MSVFVLEIQLGKPYFQLSAQSSYFVVHSTDWQLPEALYRSVMHAGEQSC